MANDLFSVRYASVSRSWISRIFIMAKLPPNMPNRIEHLPESILQAVIPWIEHHSRSGMDHDIKVDNVTFSDTMPEEDSVPMASLNTRIAEFMRARSMALRT